MNIRSLIGLAAVSLILACQSHSYQIDGIARDFKDGDTICLVSENNGQLMRQTVITDGTFHFTGDAESVCLCEAYVKHDPNSRVSFFLEAGHIVLELHQYPVLSRVSGTYINNSWQQLADSVSYLSQDMIRILHHPGQDTAEHVANVHTVDSLHRRMVSCILNTARRNKDNPLGRYINENYKAPEFE